MPGIKLIGDQHDMAVRYNRLCREKTKAKLLADIQADLMVCKIEGIDHMEYIKELKDMLDEFIEKSSTV